MNIELFKKKIIRIENSQEWQDFITESKTGERYYLNDTDIKRKSAKIKDDNILKVADNRDSYNWHGLLVDQKAAYMFGKEPGIDVGDKEVNKKITKILGDEWGKNLNDLVRKAANAGITWLHYWTDENGDFQYGIVPTGQIIPIYSDDLKQRLLGVARKYPVYSQEDKLLTVCEFWDDKECCVFTVKNTTFTPHNIVGKNESNTFSHSMGKVPYVYFNNNSMMKYDLYTNKDLIDQFEKVANGFANDIEDVQEIIFILQGYGGEELQEFMKDLKDFKTVKVDEKGDVRTVKAEIPVEARKALLELLRKAIIRAGMGVDPDKENLGDSSGVALKFLYSLLELKSSKTRTEFDCSIKVLIRAILDHLGKNTDQDISITYYKNMVTNDKEVVEILSKSGTTISEETKTKNHPYTENLDEERQRIKDETAVDYDDGFGKYVKFGADSDE